jgi:hypothetical protein
MAPFVNELRKIRDPGSGVRCEAQKETNGVQNVRLPGPIESGDGIELGIKITDHRPLLVGFEPLQDDFFDVHFPKNNFIEILKILSGIVSKKSVKN